jgi:hypothetical protein
MADVTGNDVRDAAQAAGITSIDHHECSICGYMVGYFVESGDLYFASGCDCSWSPPTYRGWGAAADWINRQSDPAHRDRIRGLFGLPPATEATHD